MDELKMLSGEQLVEKGNKKTNVKLPEIGLKDVFRNGSWLEQKQTQAALEARKDIVDVERIEKIGTLSQASWVEDLGVAEVTVKTGGYWQYLGHSTGDKMYLNPEEALFLMELNCLLLKHNDVVVSLQEAYSLLLRTSITILHYKVYASLSRLGYKVLRHQEKIHFDDENNTQPSEYAKKINLPPLVGSNWVERISNNKQTNSSDSNLESLNDVEESSMSNNIDVDKSNGETNTATEINSTIETPSNESKMEVEETDIALENCKETCVKDNIADRDIPPLDMCNTNVDPNVFSISKYEIAHQRKVMQLNNRRLTSCKKTQNFFDSIPDLYQKQTVTVKAPEEQYIPKNVFLNLTDYVINLEAIHSKPIKTTQETSNRTYSITDEVNGPHVRRIRSSQTETPPVPPQPQLYAQPRYPQFRPFNFWRPRQNFNFFQYHLLYQRPLLQRFYMPPVPPLMYMRLNNPNLNPRMPNQNFSRKRFRDTSKAKHMKSILDLVDRLKKLSSSGRADSQYIVALNRLINTYNIRYETKLRLNGDFELVDDAIVDTIELDTDETPPTKKSRASTNFDDFNENLNGLRKLGLKLKDLEAKRQTNHRHRRALINAIRTFNKSYNAEVFMNTNYDILDQRHITLASSSDSDYIVDEEPKKSIGKKLRNPFNILKRLSEKRNSLAGSSQCETFSSTKQSTQYSHRLTETFAKNWLPDSNDFGRAEVVSKNDQTDPILDHINGDFLLEYLISTPDKFENWADLKLSFIENVKESIKAASKAYRCKPLQNSNDISPIIKPEDCTDMRSVLEKLSIVKNCSSEGVTDLKVDFDVYNRDVQNFKKSNRPKPHFMIVCMDESSKFPPGEEISALHTKYNEGVTLLFAIVGLGSVQYLQINPKQTPIYLSKDIQ